MGGPTADVGYGISIDASGSINTTDSFQGTNVDFDPAAGTFNLTSAGFQDIFICKLAGPDAAIDTAFPWAMFLPAILGNDQALP